MSCFYIFSSFLSLDKVLVKNYFAELMSFPLIKHNSI